MYNFQIQLNNVSYVIAPTLNCNYNCVYCFENKENRKLRMNFNTAEDILSFIIKQIESNKLIKSIKITWFGGEPLLSYDLILEFSKKIIAKLNKMNILY